ncbi:hypothetical protein R5H32_10770 [Defluviimonas sp. D31]|uniref:hypothetical protein n=1 Tax=Defluviimonas sp. D31 TaxID=3083253 RepID=UPI00296EB22B|nr:hypothetical protein [Defluviimonas sp. D31]MDW4549837.1 hypothetical protein [Defluviimonas sp. D31]
METSGLSSLTARISQRFSEARRLILFATVMAFAAGVVSFLRYDVAIHGLPLPIITGALYALFVGTAATVTSVLLPALCAMIEAVAISRFGVAVVAFGAPDFGLALHQSPLFGAAAVIGGAVLVRKLMGGKRITQAQVAVA